MSKLTVEDASEPEDSDKANLMVGVESSSEIVNVWAGFEAPVRVAFTGLERVKMIVSSVSFKVSFTIVATVVVEMEPAGIVTVVVAKEESALEGGGAGKPELP